MKKYKECVCGFEGYFKDDWIKVKGLNIERMITADFTRDEETLHVNTKAYCCPDCGMIRFDIDIDSYEEVK